MKHIAVLVLLVAAGLAIGLFVAEVIIVIAGSGAL